MIINNNTTYDELLRNADNCSNDIFKKVIAIVENHFNELLGDVEIENESLQYKINDMPDYEEYKLFFEDCFSRLDGHYPCASVTSDYDKSIIFNAIDKGEQNDN